ncbi:hypothetical protein XTALMG727_3416 [Xanthomonas translucens pv. arrhenatheri LMG 727]|uniref:Secreted protein n=1 Tax=Xanthomonas graminis pv. arrhenatheri LMG 727 TaxID=1195923 RepID=A0A0K3A0C4_9XANT|nr:hypothetical protein XTALMG727_3416 [Xanthomonas translucens pv. arrhenatheri LMG 727]
MPVSVSRPLALLALAAAIALPLPPAAHAAAPAAPTQQVPGVYRQAIGRLRVTALFDGTLPLPRAQLSNLDSDAIARLLDHRYVPETAKARSTPT